LKTTNYEADNFNFNARSRTSSLKDMTVSELEELPEDTKKELKMNEKGK
jgi:hypothetical protein